MTKQSISPEKFAHVLFTKIQTDFPDSSHIPSQKLERVSNEFLYLSIFLIDLGVYFAMHDSEDRHRAMDSFWDLVNASGLNMDFLNSRIQAYSESVKTDTRGESFSRLGQTFAWHCLMQDDEEVASLAGQAAHRFVDEIVEFASSVEFTV